MWIAVSVSQLSQWAGAQWGQKCSVNSCIWVILIHSNDFTNYFLKLFRHKPSISSHSKARMMSSTRSLKCFVLNILCSKTKPLRCLIQDLVQDLAQDTIVFHCSWDGFTFWWDLRTVQKVLKKCQNSWQEPHKSPTSF